MYIIESWPSRIRGGKKGKEAKPWTRRRRETGLHISCKIVLTFGSRAARALLADSSRRRRTVETTRVRLPSTFLDSVIRGKRREGGREREEASIGKSRCITERGEERTLRGSSNESLRSFQSAWVEFFAILRAIYVLCMYVYIDTGFGKIVSRAWKNLDPSLRWVVIHVKQADFQAESEVVGGWTISILVCSGSNVVMSETQVSWCLIGGSSIC